jgi:predicted Zn-dependent protease
MFIFFILEFFTEWSMLEMSMRTLEPPDRHYLLAATGWLELGNPAEARRELDLISPENKRHPDVLEVLYDVLAAMKSWTECVDVGRELITRFPMRDSGWVHTAFALHELRRTSEAKQVLEGVVERFKKNWLMRYNLACYLCQLGDMAEAWRWLEAAVRIKGPDPIKTMALTDLDLEPLWLRIRDAWAY